MKHIFSLGGSLIVPDEIDESFLKGFKKLILEYVEKGHEFYMIIGGGNTARVYMKLVEGCEHFIQHF